mmetsp:Transcript_56144/g.99984  ORF Transcript_56144/g.99984 Transcript_56144/m.99984 type:complete len:637 (+) Transcript_56144:67-1977(+)
MELPTPLGLVIYGPPTKEALRGRTLALSSLHLDRQVPARPGLSRPVSRACLFTGAGLLAAGSVRRKCRCNTKAKTLQRAFSWQRLESAKDADIAAAELVAAAGSPASLGILAVPARFAAELGGLCEKLQSALPGMPLLGVLQGSKDGAEPISLLLARGAGAAQSFFVNKEELSQAGAGLAKENPVPGIPDGKHGSLMLFADAKVPGSLTRNLLEALDARYPTAPKIGLVVRPAQKAAEASSSSGVDDWEPERDDGRQLRTRDRSDGHGWVKSDPVFSTIQEDGLGGGLTVEFKKRPFGVKRYTPGYLGKGTMVIEMQEQSRYPGDAMGQCAVNGVRTGMVVKTVGGVDVLERDFEDIMDMLNDQGIMDPDSKSAASWGDASKFIQRQPVEEAMLPVAVEFVSVGGGAISSEAPLWSNGIARRDGVIGLTLSEPLDVALGIAACSRAGPTLQVAKAGLNPDGGYAVHSVVVQGKEMPAASALKGVAQAAGLKSMKGVCIGVKRPQPPQATAADEAASWAVFPMAGVTKQGGIVLRFKGLVAEGLAASDEALKEVQFFAPVENVEAASASSLMRGMQPGSLPLAVATSAEATNGVATDTLTMVGPAVIGGAGVHRSGQPGSPTVLHRQAVAIAGSHQS